jgi:Family of unknown function (DUF6496)
MIWPPSRFETAMRDKTPLRSGTSGQKVKSRRQAVAIALSEAGASNQQTPKEKKEHLRRTKAKERRGETAKDEAEGGASHRRSTR